MKNASILVVNRPYWPHGVGAGLKEQWIGASILNGLSQPMKGFLCAFTITAFLAAGCGSLNVSNLPSDAPPVLYHNAQYNFTFSLPVSWQGYSVLIQQWRWEAYLPDMDKVVMKEQGPVIVLRHPQWKASDPYQDIPILVFTRSQWEASGHGGGFSIGAGGYEYEIGHNSKYVFAICSRFNADDSAKGWKEATDTVERNQAANAPPLHPH